MVSGRHHSPLGEDSVKAQKIYRTMEFVAEAGVTKPQLMHWVRMGVLKPFQDAYGRGSGRKFDELNLAEAKILREMTHLEIPLPLMADTLEKLRQPNQLSKKLWHRISGGAPYTDGGFWMILDLSELRQKEAWERMPYFYCLTWRRKEQSRYASGNTFPPEKVADRLEKEPGTVAFNLKKIVQSA